MENRVLSIRNLSVEFDIAKEKTRILHDVSLDVIGGEILGLVGESGSGKSITASSIMQLLPGGTSSIVKGSSILFRDDELVNKTAGQMRLIRGKEIAMIFQEPMTSLNPVFTIGKQMIDVIMAHQEMNKQQATEHALKMLADVNIREAENVFKNYPYELSGGMRQRVMIAIALSCSPALLIADEPTTALDVTIQAQILNLLKQAVETRGSAVIFISHDLAVISQLCDKVAVMYAGEVVEYGATKEILTNPKHPYTKALLNVIPDFNTNVRCLEPIPGRVPDIRETISGCRFEARCSYREAICQEQKPAITASQDGHLARCWFSEGKDEENATIAEA